MRILVAEDELSQRVALRGVLTSAGHEVLEATNGYIAWNIVQHDAVQLVITDWMMPGMDGTELIDRIRAADFPRYIYILLFTQRNDRSDVVSGLRSGADDYLTKPFDPRELLARVAVGIRIIELESGLRAARDQLRMQATHDMLTGLLNRGALYEQATRELARSQRKQRDLGLILLDVDYFKAINDQYGHMVGDQALQLIAQAVSHQKRVYDLVARWGGEEFAVVLPETDVEETLLVAERFRAAVEQARLPLPSHHTLTFSISVGVASATPDVPVSLDDLILQADKALYQAKRAGRNRVCHAADLQG